MEKAAETLDPVASELRQRTHSLIEPLVPLKGFVPAAGTPSSLDSRVNAVITRADHAGVPIEYLGVEQMFDAPRQYQNWVIAPVQRERSWREDRELAVPTPQLLDLLMLHDAGINFPALYVAHEFEPSPETSSITSSELIKARRDPTVVSEAALQALETAPPVPRVTQTTARLGEITTALYTLLAQAVPLMVGAAAAVAVAPAILAASALDGLDPILFGALPVDNQPRINTPAAWFVLTRWEW